MQRWVAPADSSAQGDLHSSSFPKETPFILWGLKLIVAYPKAF